MPVTIYRLDDEPIIVAIFNDSVDSADMLKMYQRSDALIHESENIFRVTDFRHVDTTIEEVLKMLMDARKDIKGSSSDPRIRPVLLGNNKWSKIASEALKQMGIQLPIFNSMGDALQFIRRVLAQHAS